MANKWTRTDDLNIAPGGTKRQAGFEKLTAEVDRSYERDNMLYTLIQNRGTSRQCVLSCSVSDPNTVLGTAQVESLTIAGTVTKAGQITVNVVGAEFSSPSYTTTVSVSENDTSSIVATAIRTALSAISGITDLYMVGGSYSTVLLTHKEKYTDNDSTLCMTVTNFSSSGLELPATSVDSISGVKDTSGEPDYLTFNGLNVSLEASAAEPVAFSMAYGYDNEGRPVDYVQVIASDMANLWSVPANAISYLYADRSITSGTVTYGYSALAPVYSVIRPASKDGLHWFSPATQKMYVYDADISEWVEKIRLFVAKVISGASAITSLEKLNIVTDIVHDIAEKLDADSPAVGIGTAKVDETAKSDGRFLVYDEKTGRLIYKDIGGAAPGVTNYIAEGRKFGAPAGFNLPITSGTESIVASTIARAANIITLNARKKALIYDTANGTTDKLEAKYPTDYIDNNTVGFWIFNKPAGEVVPNSAVGVSSIAVANDLIPSGTMTRVDGLADYAIKGDGTCGYYISSNLTGFPTGKQSLMFGFRYYQSGAIQSLLTESNAGTLAFGFYIDATGQIEFLYTNSAAPTGFTCETGKEYVAVFDFDGVSTKRLFINGILVYTLTNSTAISPTTFFIGKYHNASYYSPSVFEFMMLKNALLTSQQIAEIAAKMLFPVSYDSGAQNLLTGSAIGNLTAGGGLSAAYNGVPSKGYSACASLNGATALTGYIGRTWDTARDIESVTITGSSDYGLTTDTSNNTLSISLQGSNDNFMTTTDLKTVTFGDSMGTAVLTLNNLPIVSFTSHRIKISEPSSAGTSHWLAVAEVRFNERSTRKSLKDVLPVDSISLGYAYAGSNGITDINDSWWGYGRREGAYGGNRRVQLDWLSLTAAGTKGWANPFGTRKVRPYYVWAQDAIGRNESDMVFIYASNVGAYSANTSSSRLQINFLQNIAVYFNGAFTSNGYVGGYVEVLEDD